jgi:hypothetical protein
MKKLFTLAFAAILMVAFAVTVAANPNNQDFTGTPVTVVAPDEPVVVGDETTITITVANPADLFDRGIPQMGIWVNGERVQYVSELGKNATMEYIIEVDTTEEGVQEFVVAVWTRHGHPNFAQEVFSKTITVEVVDPTITLAEELEEFIGEGVTNLVNYLSRVNGEILLTIGETVISLGNHNNFNIRWSIALADGSGTLHYDIRGNGQNVVLFEIR